MDRVPLGAAVRQRQGVLRRHQPLGLLGILLSDSAGLTPEDYQGVMAVAAAKAFAS